MAKDKEFEKKYKEEGIRRIKIRQQNRKLQRKRNWRYCHFQCEMGYSDCERRGYCNGNC